ncbi:unnamed protein product [Rodentolepis nana]|uniref:Craniofacial development protein 1 n=1 Tax=Rodentolepis nana TaxID=102285 RepID=A0A0R3TSR6_RODNA|nr:unnamed protein product [Rodentolepis nana]
MGDSRVGASDSSDDEEYIPTAENEDSSSEESGDDLSDDELEKASPEEKIAKPIAEKDRDKIWEEFLEGTEQSSQIEQNSSSRSRDSLSIKPNISKEPTPSNSKITNHNPLSTTTLGIGQKRPAQTTGNRLSEAFKKLKSSTFGASAPKISTLEKSRLDWESFTEKEGIKDDLKLHNKGKDGYVERKAFEARTQERQYEMLRKARLKNLSRR